MSLSLASSIQSMHLHPISWRPLLILSSHLCPGLPSGRLPSGLPTKILYAPLFPPIRATFPAHLILLDLITPTIFGDEYRSLSSLLCSLLQSPVASSLTVHFLAHIMLFVFKYTNVFFKNIQTFIWSSISDQIQKKFSYLNFSENSQHGI
jgi:hypothetical protein